jgi:biotin carboxyl carrier protein
LDSQSTGSVHKIRVEGEDVSVRVLKEPTFDRPELIASVDERVLTTKAIEKIDEHNYLVKLNGRTLKVTLDRGLSEARRQQAKELTRGPVLVTAPMSGRVVALNVSLDRDVRVGQSLVVLEAMKMQNDIVAPKTGVVREIFVKPGTLVKAGERLCLVA